MQEEEPGVTAMRRTAAARKAKDDGESSGAGEEATGEGIKARGLQMEVPLEIRGKVLCSDRGSS